MALLFDPIKIRDITLKNRLVVSPMCQYSSTDGFANDWHLVHLGARAVGGAALVFTEAASVSPEGRISPDDLGIWKDEHIAALRRVTGFLKQHGAVAGIQLAHAGRKASHDSPWKGRKALQENEGGWQVVAPSPIPFKENDLQPHELTQEQIAEVRTRFHEAIQRSVAAGFDIIEIHAAHGYLLNEFLSTTSNQRTDEYGGSFENRIRLLLEIVEGARLIMPHGMPLFVRISAVEWTPEGWNLKDSISLAEKLKEAGVDVIDCSSGGNAVNQQVKAGPLYQVPFAEAIKKSTGILTGAVGMITNAKQAEEILQSKQADLILMGRELLRNPHFPLLAARELGVNIPWPNQYDRAAIH